MSCSCIKNNYNFVLSNLDCSTLLYEDMSDWMEGEKYSLPPSYKVQVKLPARERAVEITVFTDKSTKLKSEDLGLRSSCLPDGVYCFTVSKDEVGCGKSHTRHRAVTCQLECCWQQLVSQIAEKDGDYSLAKEIEYDIKKVHIHAENGMLKQANKAFRVASQKLKSFNCKCC